MIPSSCFQRSCKMRIWFAQLPLVFSLADLLNACLLLPNLAALLILSPQVFEATREYFAKGGTRS